MPKYKKPGFKEAMEKAADAMVGEMWGEDKKPLTGGGGVKKNYLIAGSGVANQSFRNPYYTRPLLKKRKTRLGRRGY